MPIDIVRDTAVTVLLRVFSEPVPISDALDRALRRRGDRLSPRGRRFLTQLVYGATRHAILADHVVAPLLHQSLNKLPDGIRIILRMGVFQALFLRSVTFPAMVHTSVDLAKKHGHAGTARLVNAVLNRVPQSLDDVQLPDRGTALANHLSIRYSMPRWIVDRWCAEFGAETAEAMCAGSNEEAPRTIRVNTLRTTREDLIARLAKAEIPARPHPLIPELVEIVDAPLPTDHKSFRDGSFYVQDGASMLPSHLLGAIPGDRIVDVCAAPGGKSTHIAALTGDGARIVSCDLSATRLAKLRDNCARLGVTRVSPIAADANAAPFRTGVFDVVLLDAPCTGLGTLRRRPDLKLRVQPDAPGRLAGEQRQLLRSALALCKNGGVIVYSVCTFTPEETSGVLESIKGDGELAFEDGPPWMDAWKLSAGQYRILPAAGGLDGYFLARLRKRL